MEKSVSESFHGHLKKHAFFLAAIKNKIEISPYAQKNHIKIIYGKKNGKKMLFVPKMQILFY